MPRSTRIIEANNALREAMRTSAAVVFAAAAHAFAPPTAPAVRLAPRRVGSVTVTELDDAVIAKVISAELQEMLDREWIEQACHVTIGRSAADAYLGGTPAVVTSAASIDGKGHTVSQAGALHFLSDAVVVDSGTFWRSHRGRGTGDR